MSSRRGGARPGAGAPKGNRNAVRSGKYITDRELRRAFRHAEQVLPPEDYVALIRGYRGDGSIKQPEVDQTASNVISIWRPSIAPTAPSPTGQSNNPYGQAIHRMERYGFRGALDFVRRHHRYVPAIEDVLDYVDNMDDSEFQQIKNTGGLIRDDIHRQIAIPRGSIQVCPACPWSEAIAAAEDAAT